MLEQYTANKMTRVSKISKIYQYPQTYRAVLTACDRDGLITPRMTARQIAQIIDNRYYTDQAQQDNA